MSADFAYLPDSGVAPLTEEDQKLLMKKWAYHSFRSMVYGDLTDSCVIGEWCHRMQHDTLLEVAERLVLTDPLKIVKVARFTKRKTHV